MHTGIVLAFIDQHQIPLNLIIPASIATRFIVKFEHSPKIKEFFFRKMSQKKLNLSECWVELLFNRHLNGLSFCKHDVNHSKALRKKVLPIKSYLGFYGSMVLWFILYPFLIFCKCFFLSFRKSELMNFLLFLLIAICQIWLLDKIVYSFKKSENKRCI